MASLSARFRAWVASVEFAVTTACIVVALAAGTIAFAESPGGIDGYFVVLLAGVAAPGIYRDQWREKYDNRVAGVAWGVGASLALVAVYFATAAALRPTLGGDGAGIAAFVATWLLGIVAARWLTQESA